MKIMSCIKRAFDPRDNTLELHDVIATGFCIAFIMQALIATITNALIAYHNISIIGATHPDIFNAQQYGVGCGAVIASVATAGWLKGRNRQVEQPAEPVVAKESPNA